MRGGKTGHNTRAAHARVADTGPAPAPLTTTHSIMRRTCTHGANSHVTAVHPAPCLATAQVRKKGFLGLHRRSIPAPAYMASA
jgi:hypothetical protein